MSNQKTGQYPECKKLELFSREQMNALYEFIEYMDGNIEATYVDEDIMSIDIELLEDLPSNDNPIRNAFAMHDEKHLKPLAGKFVVTAISPFSIEKREKMTMENIRNNIGDIIEDGLKNPQL